MTKVSKITPEATSLAYAAVSSLRRKKPVLSKKVLAHFLDSALYLAAQKIEGTDVKAQFLIVCPDVDFVTLAKMPSEWGHCFVPLSDTIHGCGFTELKPLLPCAGEISTYLTYQQTSSGDLDLLGLLFFPASIENLLPPRFMAAHLLTKNLFGQALFFALTASVSKQSLYFAQAGEEIFSIENGAFTLPQYFSVETEIVLSTVQSFSNKLLECVSGFNTYLQKGYKKHEIEFVPLPNHIFKNLAKDQITKLIRAIVNRRHGATLVFAPGIDILDESRYHPNGILVNIPLGVALIDKMGQAKSDYLRLIGLKAPKTDKKKVGSVDGQLGAMITGIVALSQTDGAVVFDEDLSAIGAGFFLKAPASALGRGGARRKSGESFVKANPGTAAIVISQDGEVASFSSSK